MIDWNLIEETLKSVVAEISGVSCVVLENEPRPYVGEPYIILKFRSPVANGQDETRYEQLPDAPAPAPVFEPKLCGIRQFMLSIQVHSEHQKPLGNSSITIIENIRTRLRRESAVFALRRAGLATVRRNPVRTMDILLDDRWTSVSVLDIEYAVVDEQSDVQIPNIETVELSYSITLPNGLIYQDGMIIEPEPEEGAIGMGWIYVTDVTVPGGTADNKTYQDVAETVLQTVRVSDPTFLVWIRASYPLVDVSGVQAELTLDPVGGFYSGSVSITSVAGGSLEATVQTPDDEDGAVDTINVTVDLPPAITSALFTGGYPGSQVELKENDSFDIIVTADKDFDQVVIEDFGACKPASIGVVTGQSATVSATIADQGDTPQQFAARVRVRDAVTGALSDPYDTDTTGSVDGVNVVTLNDFGVVISFGAINYPADAGLPGGFQQALKGTEQATVNHTLTGYSVVDGDTVTYLDPTTLDLTIANLTTYEAAKLVTCKNPGDYNGSAPNFRVTVTRAKNAKVTTDQQVVVIADVAPVIDVSPATARIRSGGNDGTSPEDTTITISAQGIRGNPTGAHPLIEAPILNEDGGGSRGTFQGSWSGSGASWTRELRVDETIPDEKGTFSWSGLVATGLSGLVQNTIGSGSNYVLGGCVQRDLPVPVFSATFPCNCELVDYSKIQAGNWKNSALASVKDPVEGDTTANPGSGEYTVTVKASPTSTLHINDTQIVTNNSNPANLETLLDFEELS